MWQRGFQLAIATRFQGLRALALLVCLPLGLTAARAAPGDYFEQEVSVSDPLRAEQAQELQSYIAAQKQDPARLHALFKADYSSERAYAHSAGPLRQAFAFSIGYPPPGPAPTDPPRFEPIGADAIGSYFRAFIPVVGGVHAEGIYIVPKGAKGKVPLVIAMHGGRGSPERALFHGGANYHDMVRGGVKNGYAVFAPQHLFVAPGFPDDIRNQIDARLRLVGTSLTAIEIAKISASLDVLLKRPEIDADRVAMVGLSYGGYYTLVTAALDQRIKVAVSSGYFGIQEGRYAASELSVPSDFQFPDRFSLFRDPEIAALICPRALEIQAGDHDDAEHREPGRLKIPQVAQYYERLHRQSQFRYLLFNGNHEFHDASAWEFLRAHL